MRFSPSVTGGCIRWLRQIAVLLLGCLTVSAAAPSRETIDRHVDPNVEVYGKFAAVRLPISNGAQIWNPSPIRVSPAGEIFVANYVGEIYRIVDSNNDGLEDCALLFCKIEQGLRSPTSIAFHGRELLVGTTQEIRAYEDVNGDGQADTSRTILKLPHSSDPQDWTFGLCVARDGSMYVNLSTDSYNPNPADDPNAWRGSVLRVAPDGSRVERIATGLRFAPGMAFDPGGNLYFSDNEGGGNPTEELNVLVPGKFYGHNPTKFSVTEPGIAPLVRFSTARGVCGITFNSPTNDFGGGAGGDLFAAFWGIGEMPSDGAIARVKLWRENDGTVRARETAFARIPKPYDLAFGPSGDLYVTQLGTTPAPMTPSEQPTGAIYRIIPAEWITPGRLQPAAIPRIRGNAERGKALFVERGCAQCHAMDGGTELLGPNLAHLGAVMDFNAALKAIVNPSENIRSGFESETLETNDGEIVTGRVITSDATQITLMVAGNRVVHVERAQVRNYKKSAISLMPEKLLDGMDRDSLHDLFAYLEVREQPFRIRWRHRFVALFCAVVAIGLTSWCLKIAVFPAPKQ